MGAVAAHIQTRTRKTTTDWKTGFAIARAWRRLIIDWMPRPPAEWIAELEKLSEDMPEKPERPKSPGARGLLHEGPPPNEKDWEAFRLNNDKYEIEEAEYEIADKKYKAAFQNKLDEIKEAAAVGDEVTLGLLSDRPARRPGPRRQPSVTDDVSGARRTR